LGTTLFEKHRLFIQGWWRNYQAASHQVP
jgi:hypothetical protein